MFNFLKWRDVLNFIMLCGAESEKTFEELVMIHIGIEYIQT